MEDNGDGRLVAEAAPGLDGPDGDGRIRYGLSRAPWHLCRLRQVERAHTRAIEGAISARETLLLIDQATEQRLRAERRAGELLREMAEKGERATLGDNQHGGSRPAQIPAPTLDDLGITKTQSNRWHWRGDRLRRARRHRAEAFLSRNSRNMGFEIFLGGRRGSRIDRERRAICPPTKRENPQNICLARGTNLSNFFGARLIFRPASLSVANLGAREFFGDFFAELAFSIFFAGDAGIIGLVQADRWRA
jgi:hypothetical protein